MNFDEIALLILKNASQNQFKCATTKKGGKRHLTWFKLNVLIWAWILFFVIPYLILPWLIEQTSYILISSVYQASFVHWARQSVVPPHRISVTWTTSRCEVSTIKPFVSDKCLFWCLILWYPKNKIFERIWPRPWFSWLWTSRWQYSMFFFVMALRSMYYETLYMKHCGFFVELSNAKGVILSRISHNNDNSQWNGALKIRERMLFLCVVNHPGGDLLFAL